LDNAFFYSAVKDEVSKLLNAFSREDVKNSPAESRAI
jgi:hypothetical protein